VIVRLVPDELTSTRSVNLVPRLTDFKENERDTMVRPAASRDLK
jgi:hypothetical protein